VRKRNACPWKSKKRKEIEDHLTASEERYRGVVDHIDIGIALINPSMEILTLNKKMQEWFPGCDPSLRPLCYRTFNDPPREAVCLHCPTKLTLKDGNVHRSLVHTPRGNEIRQYCITTSPLKGKNGELLGAIEMVDDVTEVMRVKGRLEETERRYQTIFESTGTAMMIIGKDMNVLEVNREFEKQSGYAKKDIEGKKHGWNLSCPKISSA
jgi:PAS domain-containing protein